MDNCFYYTWLFRDLLLNLRRIPYIEPQHSSYYEWLRRKQCNNNTFVISALKVIVLCYYIWEVYHRTNEWMLLLRRLFINSAGFWAGLTQRQILIGNFVLPGFFRIRKKKWRSGRKKITKCTRIPSRSGRFYFVFAENMISSIVYPETSSKKR